MPDLLRGLLQPTNPVADEIDEALASIRLDNTKRGIMRKLAALAVLVALATSYAPASLAQRSGKELKALRKEIKKLTAGQRDIQKELTEIKKLLQAGQAAGPAAPQNIVLNVEGLPFKGAQNSKVIIVEFSDYQCPFCGRYVHETLPQIEKDYIRTGKVKYVFSAFPLESIHPEAFKTAEAAYCAGDQEKYWEMHDQLFSNQRALGVRELSLHAQAIGLNVPTFQQCLFGEKYAPKIRAGIAEASNAGIGGTPTFLFGLTIPNSPQVRVLKLVSGAQPYTAFKTVIDSLINSPQ
jgi:protein-disulfide isomerase